MSEELKPVKFTNRVYMLCREDVEFLNNVVRPGFEDMEVHMEIFDLPSGKTLHLWCDGTADVIDRRAKEESDE